MKGEESMICKRTDLIADVEKYRINAGMEDGFELFSDVVTKGWIVYDKLIKITLDDGSVVSPYISHRRGRTFIAENDYIITENDGTKHVCGEDKIWARYELLQD